MSHWAEVDENNIVLRVLVGDNDDPNGDEGYQWLIDNLGGTWLKASYTAHFGKKTHPTTNQPLVPEEPGFRKNYPGIGYSYDPERDAFIQPKPVDLPSWILSEEHYTWVPPIEIPQDGNKYNWNEETVSWDLVEE